MPLAHPSINQHSIPEGLFSVPQALNDLSKKHDAEQIIKNLREADAMLAGGKTIGQRELAGGVVSLMLDCDPEGESGMKQAVWPIAERCRVQLAWSSDMHGGRFKGRQPESLQHEERAALFNIRGAQRPLTT